MLFNATVRILFCVWFLRHWLDACRYRCFKLISKVRSVTEREKGIQGHKATWQDREITEQVLLQNGALSRLTSFLFGTQGVPPTFRHWCCPWVHICARHNQLSALNDLDMFKTKAMPRKPPLAQRTTTAIRHRSVQDATTAFDVSLPRQFSTGECVSGLN